MGIGHELFEFHVGRNSSTAKDLEDVKFEDVFPEKKREEEMIPVGEVKFTPQAGAHDSTHGTWRLREALRTGHIAFQYAR